MFRTHPCIWLILQQVRRAAADGFAAKYRESGSLEFDDYLYTELSIRSTIDNSCRP